MSRETFRRAKRRLPMGGLEAVVQLGTASAIRNALREPAWVGP